MSKCTGCGEVRKVPATETWWSCQNYFNISGVFCSSCYNMISHDAYRNPNNPGAYTMMLLKLAR